LSSCHSRIFVYKLEEKQVQKRSVFIAHIKKAQNLLNKKQINEDITIRRDHEMGEGKGIVLNCVVVDQAFSFKCLIEQQRQKSMHVYGRDWAYQTVADRNCIKV